MSSSLPLSPSRESSVFWGEIAPTEHFAQFYENDNVLLDTLSAYVGCGLKAGESAVVIATPEHLRALQKRLTASGVNLTRAVLEDRYISLDAETALATFMINQWPDEKLFNQMVGMLLRRATAHNRRVRAFGEIVALLWARGDTAATVRLEHLWQQFCKSQPFSLFCAYPKVGFTKNPSDSFADICAAHSRVI